MTTHEFRGRNPKGRDFLHDTRTVDKTTSTSWPSEAFAFRYRMIIFGKAEVAVQHVVYGPISLGPAGLYAAVSGQE